MCVHVGGKSTPKCNEKDNFHKALPNVKKAYVTLRKFTPNLKIFYTDISAISVTLCNSDGKKEDKCLELGDYDQVRRTAARQCRMAEAARFLIC